PFTVLLLPFTALHTQDGLDENKKGPSQLIVTTALAMSGRLDSNQRPPEPPFRRPWPGKSQGQTVSQLTNPILPIFYAPEPTFSTEPAEFPTFSYPFLSGATTRLNTA